MRAESGSSSCAIAASRSSRRSVEPPSPAVETRIICGERRSSIVGAIEPSTTSRETRHASSTNASETLEPTPPSSVDAASRQAEPSESSIAS